MELTFLLMSAAAFFRTIDDVVPIFTPLFSPRKRTLTDRAGFDGQVGLFSHGRHGSLSAQGFGGLHTAQSPGSVNCRKRAARADQNDCDPAGALQFRCRFTVLFEVVDDRAAEGSLSAVALQKE